MYNLDLESAHDAGQWATDFLQATFNHARPNPTSKHLMDAAYHLVPSTEMPYDGAEAHQYRVAMVLSIDAALTDPDAVMRALRYVREQLVKHDPALGIIDRK